MPVSLEYSEKETIENIKMLASDLNDLVRLAKTQGLIVAFERDRAVVDPEGTRIDAITPMIFKQLA